jgi:hypothetical protein
MRQTIADFRSPEVAAVPIERPPTVEEVIDELRAGLTLVALRALEDGEDARVRSVCNWVGTVDACSPVESAQGNKDGHSPVVDEAVSGVRRGVEPEETHLVVKSWLAMFSIWSMRGDQRSQL